MLLRSAASLHDHLYLQSVHIVIFYVMLIFLLEALAMVWYLRWKAQGWRSLQKSLMSMDARVSLYKELHRLSSNPPQCWNLFKYWDYLRVKDAAEFSMIRHEFVKPRRFSTQGGGEFMSERKKRTFDFAMYLETVFSLQWMRVF